MSRKCIEVKTLHGYQLSDLIKIANETKSNYSHNVLQAVIMRYQGMNTNDIIKFIGKSRATVTNYINNWNQKGMESTIDNRGNNLVSSLTDDIISDIKKLVKNGNPSEVGYPQNNWNCVLLSKYVEEKYGKKFSATWIRLLLYQLGFTYKQGIYKLVKADPITQENLNP